MRFLLAQVTDSQTESFTDLLIYQGTGLMIVLMVLGSLWCGGTFKLAHGLAAAA